DCRDVRLPATCQQLAKEPSSAARGVGQVYAVLILLFGPGQPFWWDFHRQGVVANERTEFPNWVALAPVQFRQQLRRQRVQDADTVIIERKGVRAQQLPRKSRSRAGLIALNQGQVGPAKPVHRQVNSSQFTQ